MKKQHREASRSVDFVVLHIQYSSSIITAALWHSLLSCHLIITCTFVYVELFLLVLSAC